MAYEYIEIPLEDLTTPKEGYTVLLNRWWATRNGNPVCAKDRRGYQYAQCNSDEGIARKLADRLGLEPPVFVPVAFFLFEDWIGTRENI